MKGPLTLPSTPPKRRDKPWCSPDPIAVKAEAENDTFYPFAAGNGVTVTATTTLLTFTDLMTKQSISPCPSLMEATIDENEQWQVSMWFLNEPCETPDMTKFALTIHRHSNPPDYHGPASYHGINGWMNFTRMIYHTSMLWAAGTRWTTATPLETDTDAA